MSRSSCQSSLRYAGRSGLSVLVTSAVLALPGAETGDVQAQHFHNIHEEAAAIDQRLSRHIGARDAAVFHGGRLNRVHRGLAGDQIGALRDVASRIDIRHIGAQVRIDHNATIDGDPGAVEPLQVGPNPGGHNHQIGEEVLRSLKAQPLLGAGILDRGEAGIGPYSDTTGTQPLFDDRRTLLIDHAWQNLGGDFDDGELGTACENRIQDGKGDKACPHHHHGTALADLAYHALGLLQRPEAMDARTVRPGHGRAYRRRARRNQQVVIGESRCHHRG